MSHFVSHPQFPSSLPFIHSCSPSPTSGRDRFLLWLTLPPCILLPLLQTLFSQCVLALSLAVMPISGLPLPFCRIPAGFPTRSREKTRKAHWWHKKSLKHHFNKHLKGETCWTTFQVLVDHLLETTSVPHFN